MACFAGWYFAQGVATSNGLSVTVFHIQIGWPPIRLNRLLKYYIPVHPEALYAKYLPHLRYNWLRLLHPVGRPLWRPKQFDGLYIPEVQAYHKPTG
jgi:hypothetical protein